MALDRDELAARCLVARLSALNAADAYRANADAIAENAIDCTDALLARLRPEAVAPATEPRRTVGAVVRDGTLRHYDEDDLLIVVADDPAACQRFLDNPRRDLSLADAYPEDEFVRWATREECERHGIPYVARPLPGAPLAAPSRPEWVRITSLNAGGKSFLTVGKVYRVTGFGHRGCPQVNNDQGDGMWCLSSRGLSPDPESPTFASWEPCAAPSPAASPAPYVPKCGDVVRHINDAPGTDDRIVTESLCDGAFRMLSLRYSNLSSSGYNVAAFWRFVRPATASERAAAGLPPVDAPAFDEAREREAARASWEADASPMGNRFDTYIDGWLARARVAAKGGVA